MKGETVTSTEDGPGHGQVERAYCAKWTTCFGGKRRKPFGLKGEGNKTLVVFLGGGNSTTGPSPKKWVELLGLAPGRREKGSR